MKVRTIAVFAVIVTLLVIVPTISATGPEKRDFLSPVSQVSRDGETEVTAGQIAVGRNGTLYASYLINPWPSDRKIVFTKSHNHGRTWKDHQIVVPEVEAPYDPQLLVTDEAIYLAFTVAKVEEPQFREIYLARSTDHGRSWELVGSPIAADQGGDNDHAVLARRDGCLLLAWNKSSGQGVGEPVFSHSCNGGETWSSVVTNLSRGMEGYPKDILVDSGGQVHLGWTNWNDGNVYLVSSTNLVEWTVFVRVSRLDNYPYRSRSVELAEHPEGRLVAFWDYLSNWDGSSRIFYATKPAGGQWSQGQQLLEGNFHHRYPQVAFLRGNPYLSLTTRSEDGTFERRLYRGLNPETWKQIATFSRGSSYNGVQLAVSHGKLHALWRHTENSPARSTLLHRSYDPMPFKVYLPEVSK